VIELVLDASVIVKWFKDDEVHVEEARAVKESYLRGDILVVVPPLLFVEVLNVAARRWHWTGDHLDALAEQMDRLGFVVRQPGLRRVASWSARGLTAYDACYVALAEERRALLLTADERILALAAGVARPLGTSLPT
jgi:predicted nucleic acid-binding protein